MQHTPPAGTCGEAIDRHIWPWHSAPDRITDYDAAAWYAIRASSDGELPRQPLDEWVTEQRARRSRDVIGGPC